MTGPGRLLPVRIMAALRIPLPLAVVTRPDIEAVEAVGAAAAAPQSEKLDTPVIETVFAAGLLAASARPVW